MALALAALAFSGCDWTMFGYDSSLTHFSADKAINNANISTVKQLFTHATASSDEYGSPVEANGVVYVEDFTGGLEAFDANGVTNCTGTPNQCNPLWSSSTGSSSTSTPAVANGVVYTDDGLTLSAFDANGVTNCSGTPKTCQPLWTASLSPGGFSSVLVVNGLVYVGGSATSPSQGRVEAFDAGGITNCTGTPKTCQPLWTSGPNVGLSSPAVANGVLYAVGQDARLYAYSALGATNCSGTPKTCIPLWTAAIGTMSASPTNPGSPTVANGIVYAQSQSSSLYAFDANGVTNCSGTPKTCRPLWTASVGSGPGPPSPAVANGIVYAASGAAFDANGTTNCSGSPKTCTPLWSYNVVGTVSSPSIANGMVFFSIFSTDVNDVALEAFDANGNTNCSGTPKTCIPLWTGPTRYPVTGDPAIANGKVYDTDNLPPIPGGPPPQGDLYAWVLPPPTTFVAVPSNHASVSGSQVWLDASASAGVTSVQYELTGGSLNHTVIAHATATIYGWLAEWNTTTVPNGNYTLESVATYGGEVTGTSLGVNVTVSN